MFSSDSSPYDGNKFSPSGLVFPERSILRSFFTQILAIWSSTKERFSSITKTSSAIDSISDKLCSGNGHGIFKAVNATVLLLPPSGKRVIKASLISLAIFPTPIIPSLVLPFFTGR